MGNFVSIVYIVAQEIKNLGEGGAIWFSLSARFRLVCARVRHETAPPQRSRHSETSHVACKYNRFEDPSSASATGSSRITSRRGGVPLLLISYYDCNL